MELHAAFTRHGPFLRRRDLLALGHSDRGIRAALAAGLIFRVRHGWYALPGTPDDAVRAIRLGGRLAGASALLSYGCIVPRPERTEIVVPCNACRLRRPDDRRARLRAADRCRIRWVDDYRGDEREWRVSVEEAIAQVLRGEPRSVAIACCDAAIRKGLIGWNELDRLFAEGPARARPWRELVTGKADAFGETYVMLGCHAAGIPFVPQPYVPGAGRFDGQIGKHVYTEIDGIQHAEDYDGVLGGVSAFESDHDRDVTMAIRGDRVLRFTYRQILTDWDRCLAAMLRAIADDELLSRARARRPYVPPSRRRSTRLGRPRSTRRGTSGAASANGAAPAAGAASAPVSPGGQAIREAPKARR
ncbi:MAG: type IV toxin-antitoxin system AbiEi family antitoxin domain-containing protein [Microbacteriaceae bacterium]